MDTVIPYPPTAEGGPLRRRNVARPEAVQGDAVVPPQAEAETPDEIHRANRRRRRPGEPPHPPRPLEFDAVDPHHPRLIRPRRRTNRRGRRRRGDAAPNRRTFSRVYCMVSAVSALLAIIVVAPTAPLTIGPSRFLDKPFDAAGVVDVSVVENVAKAAAMGLKSSDDASESTVSDESTAPPQHRHQRQHAEPHQHASEWDHLIKSVKELVFPSPPVQEDTHHQDDYESSHKRHNPFRFLFPSHHNDASHDDEDNAHVPTSRNFVWKNLVLKLVDPALLHPSPSSMTDIIDKVLSSNVRLVCLANLNLAMTFFVYTAIVNVFLGADSSVPDEFGFMAEDGTLGSNTAWAGRERLGGFLVFKLLLISAVVVPDKLDLMILLSWYTLLSFLRSLAHLAAATTAHTSQSGQAPRRGVLRLLLAVLVSDVCAAAVCVALFHGAGWGMVLLLACDCALLGVEVLCHVLRHASQALEERHAKAVREMEERQLELHRLLREATRQQHQGSGVDNDALDESSSNREEERHELRQRQQDEESRQLDRRMEAMEGTHSRRLAVLDIAVFCLQIVAYSLTVAHFCHIWSLHGLHFTLIDGVLALHLHSAVSSLGKKIAERRNLNRVARALDGLFEDATELEMRKASAAGDVCCICLGTMTVGHVKKVGCGHLYHTRCLREVVERARSIEAALCPLCRASVVNGRHSSSSSNNNNNNNNNINATNGARNNDARPQEAGEANPDAQQQRGENAPQQQQQQQQGGVLNNNNNNNNAVGGREHALFRFSTENILPAWLPLPALSFEVVRRPNGVAPPDAPATDNNNNNNGTIQQQQQQQVPENADRNNEQQPPERQPSFWRRMLVLSGAVPMSPEEEALALDQLVDMFPQYERADLQRELRQRGSAEAVVEAVLQGVFSGVARGGGVAAIEPNNQEDDDDEEDA